MIAQRGLVRRFGVAAVAVSLAAACLAGCGKPSAAPAAAPHHDDLDVLEALLRCEIRPNFSVDVYFVDFGDGKDPPPGFLERFADLDVQVRGVSRASIGLHDVLDTVTGQKGWVVHARIIQWIDTDTARAECGYFYRLGGGGRAAGIVRRNNGTWAFRPREVVNFD